MADIRQDTSTGAQGPDRQTQSGSEDGFWAKDSHLETELERAERRRRYEREHPIFGVHPDGFGPTLGQDLGAPNPGGDAAPVDPDWEDESYDPPT
jgi:hypothetical protein